ncbi:MAG: HNH endonuclease [Acidimicrobiia bacterium]
MFETGPVTGTIDELEQDFARLTAAMSRLDALRLGVLRQLDVAQVATADGARSLVEWLSGRFDLEADTARRLVGLARAADAEIEGLLESGEVTTDRAAAVVGLKNAGADQNTVDRSWSHDLAGVRRMAAAHRRITSSDESDAYDARYLHTQPTLDESSWRFWGQLTGTDGHIVDKALRTAIDSLPDNPDTTASQDRADALVAVASEWLSGEIGGHQLTADIFIDGSLAVATGGEAGAMVAGDVRVGPNTLSEILCAGTVRINFQDEHGVVSTSPSSRAIPGAVRNRVLHRDGHRCVIAGCNSRSRLQPHHLIPYAQGGSHHPDNLVTVCWYHHHVVIHQQGRRIDPNSPPQRRTFIRESDPARAGP